LSVCTSTTQPAQPPAIDAGQRHFGENYLQEALDKIAALENAKVCWHFIGPIQSNKTKQIAQNFDWVHRINLVNPRLNAC
jgi:uncharacterized pyridoxal phosphate-containing UPF0001 family protein